MISILGNAVPTDTFVTVLLCLIIIGLFIYKEWPEFKKRMSGDARTEAISETEAKSIAQRVSNLESVAERVPSLEAITQRVSSLEESQKTVVGKIERLEKGREENTDRLTHVSNALEKINDMLSRDYIRLNTAEKLARANADAINDSLEERRIIMQALLACLVGLQQVGANGKTVDAVNMINEYLNRQAHVNQEIKHDVELPKINKNI